MATWRANWRAPEHDQSLFGRTLMLPVQKGDSVWLACVGAPVPPPRGAAAVNFRVPPHGPWHGWQIAVDGSWGWSPCGRSKIASWGLVLWCEFVSPTCWVGMGGVVDPDADGCCGSARAELDALRVALQYCICPPCRPMMLQRRRSFLFALSPRTASGHLTSSLAAFRQPGMWMWRLLPGSAGACFHVMSSCGMCGDMVLTRVTAGRVRVQKGRD